MTRSDVIIVGGGFSGMMLAVHLLSDPRGPGVVLIERAPVVGRGRAYADLGQPWRLNVCAGNMSAFPADPGHFLRWWAERNPSAAHDDFVERRIYGRYLQDILGAVRSRPDAAERLRIVHGEAVGAACDHAGAKVRLRSGETLSGERLVLALGAGPPRPLPGLEGLDRDLHVADPWSAAVTDGLNPGDEVLLLGSGLTMIDAALALASAGASRIHALSRRGLTPRAHKLDGEPRPEPPLESPRTATGQLRLLRRDADALGWRAAVDARRPVTTQLWRSLPPPERQRMLRHLRPWWDAHRHRLAPELAEQVSELKARGRLHVSAGRLIRARAVGRGVEVIWRHRGSWTERALSVRRVVNCTGLGGLSTLRGEPLVRSLLDAGRIRADRDRLGVDVDDDSRAYDALGCTSDRLFVLGPLTQGAFWEATAVPDLRNRVLLLAEQIRRLHDRSEPRPQIPRAASTVAR
jgi:uncharacterized NAD(P)/FAD-binding protein YdhS